MEGNLMSKWINIRKKKPKLGDTVLVFEQGYGEQGNYWSNYYIATYIKNPHDKRKYVFADQIQVAIKERWPWVYWNVTHWMPLPDAPPQITPEDHEKYGIHLFRMRRID